MSKNQDLLSSSQTTSVSYTIDFADVKGKLKDVYTVTAKIKNTGDEAYSYDSFVLHVYDAQAMKIWVDKQEVPTLTMDNEGRIKDLSSADIIAMERNISLTNNLSINYGDYSYGLVTDQIEWKTTEISDNAGTTNTITPVEGFYRQAFDITRFWSAEAGETSPASVNATDKIDYIFEFHFGNDEYQPQIIKFSGNLSGADVLRFGESLVNLVPSEELNQPFFSAQYLNRFKNSGRLDNIKNSTGNIGLNAQTPQVRIDTQALWWGRPLSETNAAISLLNETGIVPAGQNYKTFQYPFATMLVTEHQLLIDESNIWMDKKGRGKVTVKLYNDDGTLYNSSLAPYSIRNMLDVENVQASQEINNKFQGELQKNIKAGSTLEAKDKFAQSALDLSISISKPRIGKYSPLAAGSELGSVMNTVSPARSS
ncbi:MAG: hypothetical protein GX119_07775 [Syntrophomonadaceae bacterium]|nr:hypothetical protein [Syntrophomonadaceae bacterium]